MKKEKKQQKQNKPPLSSFYAKFYFKLASYIKWPIFIFLLIVLGSSLVILISEQLTDAKYHFYAIETDSMVPTLDVGDMIVVERQESYQVDDIVSFKYKSDDRKPITHRIVDETDSDQYITKGDNNTSQDPLPVSSHNIIGKVIRNIPKLGEIVLFMRSVEGIIILYIIPITILLTLNAQSIYKWLEVKAKE